MILILIFLFVFLLFVPVLGNKFVELLGYVNINDSVIKILSLVIKILEGPILWFLVYFLIKIIYTMAPDEKIASHYMTHGALFTAFGLSIVTYLYSFYVNTFSHYDVLYGGLAHFVVLMIWIYLLSYIIIIGIAINVEEYEKREKLGVLKN